MLSPQYMAQPNPRYPALSRHTTSPWSTDYGGNIYCKTRMMGLAVKSTGKKNINLNFLKKLIKEIVRKNEKLEERETCEEMKVEVPLKMGQSWAHLVHRGPKTYFH